MLRLVRVFLVLAPLLALCALSLSPRPGGTLPLFARKYSMPCTQCHLAFPRLNVFGMKFRQNGYRLEGEKGASPWESQNFPLSLVGNVGYDYVSADVDTGGGNRVRTNISEFVQNAVEFHTAGTLAEKVTFHFDNGFASETGLLESGMAFVQFDDVAKDGALNVKAGIYDAEIPYLSDARSTTLHEYMMPVAFDARGIELNGTKSGWTYAAAVINSDRTVGKPDSKTLNNFENVYAWLMRDLGGSRVAARVYRDQQDPRDTTKNASQRLQADLSAFVSRGPLLVIPAYTYEKFSDQSARDKVHSGLLEALLLLGKDQRWAVTGRFELQHVPKTSASAEEDHSVETVDLAYYVNPNARVALDWTHASDNIRGPRVDDVQVFVHVGY